MEVYKKKVRKAGFLLKCFSAKIQYERCLSSEELISLRFGNEILILQYLPKKFRMAPDTVEKQDENIVKKLINQQPVGVNMTFSAAFVIP